MIQPGVKKKFSLRPAFIFLVFFGLLVLSLLLICFRTSIFHHYRITNKFEDVYVSSAAQKLPRNGSIFVWVMTTPCYHETRIPAINSTWLGRLEHGVVFTSTPLADERIPFRTVFQNFDEKYESLFHKTKFGFYYAYKNFAFDWYVKSDDDTYLVAENLKKFLNTLDPSKPVYAGFRLKPYVATGYNNGGVYVLSRAAVKIFVETLYHNETMCPFDRTEDLGMGRCLMNAGIYPIPTRDDDNRGRFHLSNAWETFSSFGNYEFYFKDDHQKGFDEFSPSLISLHHMNPADLITADLFLYRVNLN